MNTLEDAYIDIARQEEHLLANIEKKNSQYNNRNGPHEKYKKTNEKL